MIEQLDKRTWVGKFLYFIDCGPINPGRITHTYDIHSKASRQTLCSVVYWNHWRKFVMQTMDAMVFDGRCLSEVVEFLALINGLREARLEKG